MPKSGQVHWCEGQFLVPQHFQSMQRQLQDYSNGVHQLALGYYYGLVDASLNRDALANFIVRFDRLQCVMPSGLHLEFPGNLMLEAMDIREAWTAATGPLRVSLGIPLWRNDRGNTSAGGQSAGVDKNLYVVKEYQTPDENTGDNVRPVETRLINGRLLLDSDDRSGMELLPLARIAKGTGDSLGKPEEDMSFIPPCVVLEGSNRLRGMVRDFADEVAATQKELASLMRRAAFSIAAMQPQQFEQFQRLRALGRFSVRMGAMAKAPRVAPFQAYLELCELLAELTAMEPDPAALDLSDKFKQEYNHEDPALAFFGLIDRLRPMLKGIVKGWVKTIPFVLGQAAPAQGQATRPVYMATLAEEDFTKPNGYFLSLTSKLDTKEVVTIVQNELTFKVVPKNLMHRMLFGLKVEHEPVPPTGLPARQGLHYFRINRDSNKVAWDNVTRDKALFLHWPTMANNEFGDLKLCLTIPETA